MNNLIKKGLWCMLAAVLLMPLAFVFKSVNDKLTLALLFLSMVLELIGLVFVIRSMLMQRRANKQ
ncbi:hypothetical protein [Nubsella zeaxanthinifaciens]|jgi:O-antigen/teichoic acid export membrane protein|uniref:hypothetical protein n=1 Tax=Nubsella zeaxanthinifaciens TaxID=392412 RepID=UPI000DE437BF|nr:hypothetical protein [Nubsella zeaxanthinifaciens]